MSSKPRKNKRHKNRKTTLGLDKFTARMADKQANDALKQVWCADGKMFAELQNGGVHDGVFPMPNNVRKLGFVQDNWDNIIIKQISLILEYKPLEWTVWIGVFQSDGVKEWCTSEVCDDLGKMNNNLVGPIVDSRLDKLRDSRNHRHVISYGWFATPKKEVDVEDLQAKAIEYFTREMAFDKDHCEKVNEQRKIADKLKEMA